MNQISRTYIYSLDRLIGLSDKTSDDQKDLKGKVVLIRGEPGSGKTTLALQIVSSILQHCEDEHECGAYLSLEQDPKATLVQIKNTFKFLDDSTKNRIQIVKAEEIERFLHRSLPSFAKSEFKNISSVIDDFKKNSFQQAIVTALALVCSHIFGKTSEIDFKSTPQKPSIVFIDSLNAFVSHLSVHFKDVSLRVLLNLLAKSLMVVFNESLLIFSSEFHYDSEYLREAMGESFFCDIEIALRPEQVTIPIEYHERVNPPLGYDKKTIIRKEANKIESRSFCRVLKSRISSNQSRRISYDIEQEKGFVFYATYPGDGEILLFQENEPQRSIWQDFLDRDLPVIYPALRFSIFNRANLQAIYEERRRIISIPLRTDMSLSCFDVYWIDWHFNFKLKKEIVELLEKNKKKISDILKTHDLAKRNINYYQIVNAFVKEVHINGNVSAEEFWIKNFDLEQNTIPSLLLRLTTDSLNIIKEKIKPDEITFLVPLPYNKLSLFGGRKSEFIEAMQQHIKWYKKDDNKQYRKSNKDENDISCYNIPYNANVGLLVYRKDLLKTAKFNKNQLKALLKTLINEEIDLFKNLMEMPKRYNNNQSMCAIIEEIKSKIEIYLLNLERIKINEEVNILMELLHRLRKDKLDEKIKMSWEQIIILCQVSKFKTLIETQTFDTYLSTFLEVFWNLGGEFKVSANFKIDHKNDQLIPLIRALHIFRQLFHKDIVPRHSNLEPEYLDLLQAENQWLFARHWYSTLIDVLTKKDENDEFVWKSRGKPISLEIIQIPQSIFKSEQPQYANENSKSCCGVWSFGLLEGSENIELAIDLVNNLMSSQRIEEQAFKGACIPTVEDFYQLHGDRHAINIVERADIEQPRITFEELKINFLDNAKSRTDLYSYRHCAGVIFAALEKLNCSDTITNDKLIELAFDIFDGIEDLNNKEIGFP